MAVLQFCLLTLFVVSTKGSNGFSNRIVLSDGFYVSWNFNAPSDTLEFLVEAKATGWVGFDVAEKAPNAMVAYDVAIGGVLDNGTGYLQDYLTVGIPVHVVDIGKIAKRSISSGQPELDFQQDWMLLNSSEEDGVTSLRFSRKLNTTDQQGDVIIQQGMSIFVIWAYHRTDDLQPEVPQSLNLQFPEFPQHSARGFQNVTFIPAILPTKTTPTSISANMATSVVIISNGSQQETIVPSSTSTTTTTTPSTTNGDGSVVVSNSGSQQITVVSTTTVTMVTSTLITAVTAMSITCPAPTMVVCSVVLSNSSCQEITVVSTTTVTSTLTPSTATTTTAPGSCRHYSFGFGEQLTRVSHEWLAILRENNKTNSRNNAPSPNSNCCTREPVELQVKKAAKLLLLCDNLKETTQFTHSFDNNRFRFLWKYDDQNDKISYHIRVKTTGWVGFGFAKTAPNNMQSYDVIVGGFKDGKGYLNPSPDSSQDYKLLSASEAGGYTELMFERSRDTGDSNDVQFEAGGQVYIIWAYAVNDIKTVADFVQHSNRGWSDETVVVVPEAPIPTQAAATSLHLSNCGTVIVTIVLVVFAVMFC